MIAGLVMPKRAAIIGYTPTAPNTTATATMSVIFQRRLFITVLQQLVGRFDNRGLALKAADRGARNFDAQLVGDLELHGGVAHLDDLTVDAAGGDDPIADFQRGEEFVDLLLLTFAREQDREVDDAGDKRERNDRLQQRATALTGGGHR